MWNLKNDIKKIHHAISGHDIRHSITEALSHIDKALVALIMCQVVQGIAIIIIGIKLLQ